MKASRMCWVLFVECIILYLIHAFLVRHITLELTITAPPRSFSALQTGEARELKPLPLAAAAAAGKAPALRATQATLGSIASCGSSTDHAQVCAAAVPRRRSAALQNFFIRLCSFCSSHTISHVTCAELGGVCVS